jgi:hypothetical protein
MNITITINTDNAAFHEDYSGVEVARILRKLADEMETAAYDQDESCGHPLMDYNGNKVGRYEVTE